MLIFFAQLQMLFGVMVAMAAVLFVVWIIKYRSDQMMTWMFFLFAIGFIGLIVSSVLTVS